MAQVLLKNTSIQHLDLHNNEIGDKGIEFLSIALCENKSLQSLLLTNNRIEDKGAEYLAQALLKNTSLQRLCLGCNGIDKKGYECLAQALLINTSLQELVLYRNYIFDERMAYFAQALLTNTSLQSLDLRDNHICGKDKEAESAIRKALQINPSLKEFQGIQLVENVDNETTLEKWRLEKSFRVGAVPEKVLAPYISEEGTKFLKNLSIAS